MMKERETRAFEGWSEAEVEQTLRQAGPLAEIPGEDLEAMRLAARREWQRTVRPAGRRWVGWRGSLAAALAAGLGLAGLWMLQSSRAMPSGPPIASVAAVSGQVELRREDGPPLRAEEGLEVSAGWSIVTGPDARVALRTAAGGEVRWDESSRGALESEEWVGLERGGVFVDTRGGPEITVSVGEVELRPIGTRFEVRTEAGEAIRLRVREGRVEARRGESSGIATVGQEIRVSPVGLEVVAGPAPWDTQAWAWVGEAAPPFALEGASVSGYLAWVARESGWRLEIAGDEARARIESSTLHGEIDNLVPAETPDVVLPTVGLDHRIVGGTLVVGLAAGGPG